LRIGNPTLHTRTAVHFAGLLTGATFTMLPSDPENKTVLSGVTDGERELAKANGKKDDSKRAAAPAPAKGNKKKNAAPIDPSWIIDCQGVGYVNRFL
jgi:hypothetical protein